MTKIFASIAAAAVIASAAEAAPKSAIAKSFAIGLAAAGIAKTNCPGIEPDYVRATALWAKAKMATSATDADLEKAVFSNTASVFDQFKASDKETWCSLAWTLWGNEGGGAGFLKKKD